MASFQSQWQLLQFPSSFLRKEIRDRHTGRREGVARRSSVPHPNCHNCHVCQEPQKRWGFGMAGAELRTTIAPRIRHHSAIALGPAPPRECCSD
jgi:hypothetical protein